MNLAGIDIAKDTLDIQLRQGDHTAYRPFPNSPAGHRQAVRWLRQGKRAARVCLEATGVYHLPLALALHQAEGIELMVLNPRAARRFAEAQMRRAKTDKVDATVLLHFLERMPFKSWHAPEPAVLELSSLTHRLAQLKKEVTRERSRLHAAQHAGPHTRYVQQDIQAHLQELRHRVERLATQAIDSIKHHPRLHENLQLIDSIPGFAETAAGQILAEVQPLASTLTAKQWTAQAGLDPRPQESGASHHSPRRISKQGNARLRAALFFPAMVAIQHDPHVRAFYDALRSRGKSPRQAQVAVMRKLLHAIWGILHHRQPWDGRRFYRMTTT